MSHSKFNAISYYYHDFWESHGDPRVSGFPLMSGGPWPILTLIGVYIMFVKGLGPKLMKHRAPYNLRATIFVYNSLMCIFNGYTFYAILVRSGFTKLVFHCAPAEPDKVDHLWQWRLQLGWLYTMSKLVDLMDTVFFVLRKNYHQVSTLHVVHHSLVPINCWLGLKYIPSESVVFFPFANSFVHFVMYFYYALTTLGPWVKPYLWWKPWVTKLQIVQLAAMCAHCIYITLAPDCHVPKILFAIGIPEAMFFVYMFIKFFINSYKIKIRVHKN
ncbi:putative protein for very long chain fatty acid elongation [Halotydeus destructor]|nr:putative protein for very long chain fatty acid elongation [Halotydeus destructor]